MNYPRIIVISTIVLFGISNKSDHLYGQRECHPEQTFQWVPLMSEQTISLKCENCSALEFGSSLKRARDDQRFPLTFDEYDEYLETGSFTISKEVLGKKISLELDRAPFWNAVGKIASETNLGILTDFDGHAQLTDGLDSPSNHWTVVGPMLLRANFEALDQENLNNKRKAHNIKATHQLELRFNYGDGEADRFDMQLSGVAVKTKSNQLHKIKLQRYSDGTRFGKLPVSKDEIVEIHGKMIANVAKKLLWLQIRPNSVCKINSFEMQAKCSEVKSTKKLVLNRKNQRDGVRGIIKGTTYLPAKGHDKIHYINIELEWKTDTTEKQKKSLMSLSQVPWDRINTTEVNFFKNLMEDNLFLDFVRNRPCKIIATDGRVPDRSKLFSAAPNCFAVTDIGKASITLFSEDRNKVDTCHELLFARKGILDENFTIISGLK